MTEHLSPTNSAYASVPANRSRPPQNRSQAEAVDGEKEQGPNADRPMSASASDPESIKRIADAMGKSLSKVRSDLSITVDEDTGHTVVQIKDGATGEVVKQIPAQEILEAEISVDKIIGVLIDDLA